MFDIDTGGGSQGPWIQWQVLPSRDGQIPGKSFYIRDADHKEVFNGFAQGVVLDIQNIKVGWQHSEGVKGRAPDWKWWPAPNQRIEKPGDDWKWGMSLPCAIGDGKTATWEQAGAAVQNAIKELTPVLQQGPGDGSLPMVRLKDVRSMSFGAGTSEVPILEIVKWVPRPDCLKEGRAAAVASAVSAEPAPQSEPAPASKPADVSDDIAF